MKKCMALLILLLLSGCSPREDAPMRPEPPSSAAQSVLPDSAAPVPPPQTSSSAPTDAGLQPIALDEPAGPVFAVSAVSREMMAYMEGISHTGDSPVDWEELALVTVGYIDFDGAVQTGVMVVHTQLAQEVADIFEELYRAGFPIAGIRLIEEFGGDDNLSMEANNTYAYCTRLIAGSGSYSLHSYGVALDINPVQNPYMTGTQALPAQSSEYLDRTDVRPGMITEGDACYTAFVSRGWSWGGHWASPDYQHFEKRPS